MKKKPTQSKEPSTPNVRKGLTTNSRKKQDDPSSTESAGGNKRLQRTSKLKEQRESLKNSK